MCRWHLDPNKEHFVSCVFHMLTKMESIVQAVRNDIIWNKTTSLRVSLVKSIYLCLAVIM